MIPSSLPCSRPVGKERADARRRSANDSMFSYVTPEDRVRADHPLRTIRTMTDAALQRLSPRFDRMYSTTGRPSIPPEKLLRALLLQTLYSIAQRAPADGGAGLQRAVSVVCRAQDGRCGVGGDDVYQESGPTARRRHRRRLLWRRGRAIKAEGLLSDEHFTVDGTLLEAWASHKSFQPTGPDRTPPDDPKNPTVNFHGQTRRNATHQSTTDPDARLYKKTSGGEANWRIWDVC